MPSPRIAPPTDPDFADGAASALARSVSAEIRARMAAQRITGRDLAAAVGMSHTYLAKRLRDELPFTLDDVDRFLGYWEEDLVPFMQAAHDTHYERIWLSGLDARRRGQAKKLEAAELEMLEIAPYSAVKRFKQELMLISEEVFPGVPLSDLRPSPSEIAIFSPLQDSDDEQAVTRAWREMLLAVRGRLEAEVGAMSKRERRRLLRDHDLAAHDEQHTINSEQ